MESFETIMTVGAVVLCAAAWFWYQKKSGKSFLGALKSTKNAVRDRTDDD